MTQNIIVYIIIALVLGYIIYSVIKNMRSKNKAKCPGCGGCSASEEIGKSLKEKKFN